MTRGRMILLAGTTALALVLAFGCSLLPREESGAALGYSVKLQIQAPAASKGITVGEFDVTGLHIEVRGSGGEPLANIDWAAEEGKRSYDVPVPQPGEYRIVVTHLGGSEEAPVQATEEAAFEIRAMKITVIDIVPGAIGTILVEGGNGGGTISGRVYDWITGAGIAGATVVFGGYSGTTDLSGAYSITVPDSVSSVDGVFAAFKGLEYTFLAAGGISVDPTTDPVYNIGLDPTNAPGYPERNLSGRIYDNTATELSDGVGLGFHLINANGGQWYATSDYAAGYSLSTKTFGSGCFVNVVAKDDLNNTFSIPLLQFYLQDQNLSVGLNGYDLTQPPDEDFTTVTVNGTGGSGSMFYGFLIVPNRGWVGITGGEFDEPFSASYPIYNPDGFQMAWFTQTQETDTPAPGETTVRLSTAVLPFSDTINLPAAYTHAPPSGAVDGASVNWNSGTRTLSFDEVDGANGYLVWLQDNDGHSSTLVVSSSSITFPGKLVTDILDASAGWDLIVWPVYSPQVAPASLVDFSLSMDLTGSPAGAPRMEMQAAVIMADMTKIDAIP